MKYSFLINFSASFFLYALPVQALTFELSGNFDPSGQLQDIVLPQSPFGLEVYYQATKDVPNCRERDIFDGSTDPLTKSLFFEAQTAEGRYQLHADIGKGEGGDCEYKAMGGKLTGPFVRLSLNGGSLRGYYPNLEQTNGYFCLIQEAFIGSFKEYCTLKPVEGSPPAHDYSGNGAIVDFTKDFKNTNFDIIHRGFLNHAMTPETLLKTLTFPSGATLKFYKNGQEELDSNSPVVLDGNFHPRGMSPGVRRMEFSYKNSYYIYPEIDARLPSYHQIVVHTDISPKDRTDFKTGKWELSGYREFLGCNEVQDENFDTVYMDLTWNSIGNVLLNPGQPLVGSFVYCFKNQN